MKPHSMFDTNRSGSVNFDEFWYVPISNPAPRATCVLIH